MRTGAKILLEPIWFMTTILRVVCRLAYGVASMILTIFGGLLLMYDLLLVILNMSSKELWLQLLAVAGAMLVIPFIAGLIKVLLKTAKESTGDFIRS